VAFDTGAPPEVSPFIVSSVDEIVALLGRLALDRDLLTRHSLLSYRFVRSRFSWETCTAEFMRLAGANGKLSGPLRAAAPGRSRFGVSGSRVEQFLAAVRFGGLRYAMTRLSGYLARRIRRG
jgi:hypothetical protein